MTLSLGSLARLQPRPRSKAYEDEVESGCIRLWSDSLRRHVPIPVGSSALIVGVLPTSYLSIDGATTVVDILVNAPELGSVVVSTFMDRLCGVE